MTSESVSIWSVSWAIFAANREEWQMHEDAFAHAADDLINEANVAAC